MRPPQKLLLFIMMICAYFSSIAQNGSFDELENTDVRIYKSVDGYDLKMSIMKPDTKVKKRRTPAIIFFFGGGWRSGDVHQFEQHCRFLAARGMTAMAANYRVESRNNTSPYAAVEDARSAMRWVRANAKELGVKRNKIVAAGGSAGGHLAACTALIEGYDSPNDNLRISPKPNALILFNPVINTLKEGYGYDRLGDGAESISPAHHVGKKAPPTLVFHGTNDSTVPFSNVTAFEASMTASGNTIYVVPFTGQGHGFFNYGRDNNRCYEVTLEKMEAFLRELKYIKY